jgi:hypothetical protein
MHRVSLDIIQKQLTLGRINQVTVLNVQQAHQHVDGPRTGRDDPACRHRRIVDGSWRRAARRLARLCDEGRFVIVCAGQPGEVGAMELARKNHPPSLRGATRRSNPECCRGKILDCFASLAMTWRERRAYAHAQIACRAHFPLRCRANQNHPPARPASA